MSLYCPQCVAYVPTGASECPKCGIMVLCCSECRNYTSPGVTSYPDCSKPVALKVEVVKSSPGTGAVPAELVVARPVVGGFVPAVALVPERYDAGRYGIEATVTIPAVDVAIMNELGQLVQLLHGMASRLNQFTGMTERTRKLIRDMRVLATDVQEEIESRRGPV